jgi:hypothetical protein
MMGKVMPRLAGRANVRLLSALALVAGLLAIWADAAKSAGSLISTIISVNNNFQAGTVDINGALAQSTPSSFPATSVFSWTTSGGGTGCTNLLPGVDVRTQGMVPGHYCVGAVTISNTNPAAIAAWMRIRVVRRTTTGDTRTEALNNRLRLYMSEYASGSGRTAAAYQAADCNPTNFRPVSPGGGAKSTASIPDVNNSTQGFRSALTSLGAAGKNLGTHPGVSAPTDTAVVALLGSGLGLVQGTGAAPSSANMVTASGSRNAYNIVGNDEVKNPRRRSNSNTNAGTNPNGTLLEAGLNAGQTRYYCVAIFFPSDTDATVDSSVGDSAAWMGDVAYHIVVDTAQQANNSFD